MPWNWMFDKIGLYTSWQNWIRALSPSVINNTSSKEYTPYGREPIIFFLSGIYCQPVAPPFSRAKGIGMVPGKHKFMCSFPTEQLPKKLTNNYETIVTMPNIFYTIYHLPLWEPSLGCPRLIVLKCVNVWGCVLCQCLGGCFIFSFKFPKH